MQVEFECYYEYRFTTCLSNVFAIMRVVMIPLSTNSLEIVFCVAVLMMSRSWLCDIVLRRSVKAL